MILISARDHGKLQASFRPAIFFPPLSPPQSILPFPTKKMRNPQQDVVMTNKINHTSVHTHLEKARGMQPLEFMKVAVYLLCATAAVLVMSLQYHLFRDCPTKLAICVVSSNFFSFSLYSEVPVVYSREPVESVGYGREPGGRQEGAAPAPQRRGRSNQAGCPDA